MKSRFGLVEWQTEFENRVVGKALTNEPLSVNERVFLEVQMQYNLSIGRTMLESPTHYVGFMTPLLREARRGKSELKRAMIKRKTVLRHYDHKKGRFFYIKFDRPALITRLLESENVWMSDTPQEAEGIAGAVKRAYGDVLCVGLGIGYFPFIASKKLGVNSVTIVEKNEDVINLVYPQIANKKTNVIQADFYNYARTTDERYDFIYLDVWGSITAPLRGIEISTKIAKRCLKPKGKIMCWLQELYNRVKDQLPKEPITGGRPGIYEPCLVCGKTIRFDYAGLCMDCADLLGVSEMWRQSGSGAKA